MKSQKPHEFPWNPHDLPIAQGPRSEVASTPSETLTAELQGLRNRLAQEEATTREMEMRRSEFLGIIGDGDIPRYSWG